jgi:hypothetical protein
MNSVKSIICHHTAEPKAGDYPSLKIGCDVRRDLKGHIHVDNFISINTSKAV